ncbi:hypothetical protein [Leptospira kirschneri]|uniref:hypothetical protein n=1 Tax=Leptospira kirschneri TaxID=29507 RepID=UPI0002984BA0|nr:hypothetical protein [Leptospira kirschneri]EKQ84260.1 hypothetical protein LEP1GSC064_0332 [Leptospira kirschneri serovar Grippotyphosa str. Moskva]EKR10019.1 hypothetical protein LEP1GSC122_3353 [Leptospira kirschneri serovar Valbuzzi str. 200702274]EMK17178.1 hypothetical protein LEP1GSC042_2836 [Leptospira kirschneri serovar Bim str. PUO 1247]EMN04536.1 hypothetical protein LEP1GSC046_3759 [Leptospira kirschneri serovar Bim str. 1051]EMO80342.1 hypothetical protein LEP1GSC126_0206 [Lept
MRLIDFQIYVRPAGLAQIEQKSCNEALFPVFEAIRLWLRERNVSAPFRKIAVSIADHSIAQEWHGDVSVALNVCEVTEACDIRLVRLKVHDYLWVSNLVLEALEHIRLETGWDNVELRDVLGHIGTQSPPCAHLFDKLRKIDRKTGIVCDVWLVAVYKSTSVMTRFSYEGKQIGEIIVAHKPGPLYIEDDLPVAATAIVKRSFVLLDRNRQPLASVLIPLVDS